MKLCKLKWRWRQMSSEKSLETQLGHREYQVHFGDPLPWSHAHDMGMEQTSPKLCIFDGCLYLGNEAWEDAWRRDGTGELFLPVFWLSHTPKAIFGVVGRAGARPGGDAHGAGRDRVAVLSSSLSTGALWALLSSHPLPSLQESLLCEFTRITNLFSETLIQDKSLQII